MSDKGVSKPTKADYMSYTEWLRTLEDMGNVIERPDDGPATIRTGLDLNKPKESLVVSIITCVTSFVLFVLIGLIRYWRLFQ